MINFADLLLIEEIVAGSVSFSSGSLIRADVYSEIVGIEPELIDPLQSR
jgi:hypothetical protein